MVIFTKINLVFSFIIILLLVSWFIPVFIFKLPFVNGGHDKSGDEFITFALNTTNASYGDIGYFVTGVSIKSINYKKDEGVICSFEKSNIDYVTLRVHTWFGIVRNEEVVKNCK